jgi:DNA polymerase elongation subunit (family B)
VVVELPETHATLDEAWMALMQAEDFCSLPRGTLTTAHAKASYDPNRVRLNGYQGHGYPCITVSCHCKHEYEEVLRFFRTRMVEGKRGFGYRVSLHECDHVDPVTRFLGETKVRPCSWATLVNVQAMATRGLCTTEVEGWCTMVDVGPASTSRRAPKLKTMCLDLEVVPTRTEWLRRRGTADEDMFVDATHDPIRQCCVVVDDVDGSRRCMLLEMSRAWQGGTTTFRGVTYTTHMYATERELIAAISDFIRFEDPDVVVTHNGNSFDWPYLFARFGAVRGSGRVHALGRRVDYRFEQTRMDDTYVDVDVAGRYKAEFAPRMPGRIALDSYALLQTGIMGGHGSCSLRALSTKYLPATASKMDLKHTDIFDAWHDTMPPERVASILQGEGLGGGDTDLSAHELGRAYCVYDGCSTLDVIAKLGVVPFVSELGALTWCPAQVIIHQKQGRRLKSLMTVEAWHDGGKVVNAPKRKYDVDAREGAGGKGKKYQGAFVFDTKIGVHGGACATDVPLDPQPPLKDGYDYANFTEEQRTARIVTDMICLLDFASLYPNTMRAAKLSHDNYVDYDAEPLPSEVSARAFAEKFNVPLHPANEIRKPWTPPSESVIQRHGSGQWHDAPDADTFVTIFAPSQNPSYKSKVYRFRKADGVLTRVLTNLLTARVTEKSIMKVFNTLEGPLRDRMEAGTTADPKTIEACSEAVEAVVLERKKATTVDDVLAITHGNVAVAVALVQEFGMIYDAKQGSRKVVCNSTYGICAFERDDMRPDETPPHTSCPAIAASTTAWARQAIGRVVDHFGDDNIVMGDTDSVGPQKKLDGTFASQPDAVTAMWKYAVDNGEFINTTFFNDGVNDLEAELVATLMVCSSKKFYGALINKNPKRPDDFNVMLKGLAPVRGDTPDVLSDMVMSALNAQFDHIHYTDEVRRKLVLRVCLAHLERVIKTPSEGGLGVGAYKMMNVINKTDSVRGAHMMVARRYAKATGEPIRRGARVEWVFVKRDPEGVRARDGGSTSVERVDKVTFDQINRLYYLKKRMLGYMSNLLHAMGIPEHVTVTMFDWCIATITEQESALCQMMGLSRKVKTYEGKRNTLERMLDQVSTTMKPAQTIKSRKLDLRDIYSQL